MQRFNYIPPPIYFPSFTGQFHPTCPEYSFPFMGPSNPPVRIRILTAEQRRIEEMRQIAEQHHFERQRQIADLERAEEMQHIAEQKNIEKQHQIAEIKRAEKTRQIAEQQELELQRIAEYKCMKLHSDTLSQILRSGSVEHFNHYFTALTQTLPPKLLSIIMQGLVLGQTNPLISIQHSGNILKLQAYISALRKTVTDHCVEKTIMRFARHFMSENKFTILGIPTRKFTLNFPGTMRLIDKLATEKQLSPSTKNIFNTFECRVITPPQKEQYGKKVFFEPSPIIEPKRPESPFMGTYELFGATSRLFYQPSKPKESKEAKTSETLKINC